LEPTALGKRLEIRPMSHPQDLNSQEIEWAQALLVSPALQIAEQDLEFITESEFLQLFFDFCSGNDDEHEII
jgi:hypothetical protein